MKCPICLGVKLSHEDECADCRAPLPEPPTLLANFLGHEYVIKSAYDRVVQERDGAIKLREMIEANRDQLRLDKVELERDLKIAHDLRISAQTKAANLAAERDALDYALNHHATSDRMGNFIRQRDEWKSKCVYMGEVHDSQRFMIKQAEGERDRLRAALERIARFHDHFDESDPTIIARAALKETK